MDQEFEPRGKTVALKLTKFTECERNQRIQNDFESYSYDAIVVIFSLFCADVCRSLYWY